MRDLKNEELVTVSGGSRIRRCVTHSVTPTENGSHTEAICTTGGGGSFGGVLTFGPSGPLGGGDSPSIFGGGGGGGATYTQTQGGQEQDESATSNDGADPLGYLTDNESAYIEFLDSGLPGNGFALQDGYFDIDEDRRPDAGEVRHVSGQEFDFGDPGPNTAGAAYSDFLQLRGLEGEAGLSFEEVNQLRLDFWATYTPFVSNDCKPGDLCA